MTVVDNRSNNLKLLNNKGLVLRTIGRHGQGPGEFTRVMDATYMSEELILALDAGAFKVLRFDTTGVVAGETVLNRQDIRSLVALPDSMFLVGGLIHEPVGAKMLVGTYAMDGTPQAAFLSPSELFIDVGLVVDQVWIARDNTGLLFVGTHLEPDIHVYTADGKALCILADGLPEWLQLLPDDSRSTDLVAMREWINAATLIKGTTFLAGRLFLQYGYPQRPDDDLIIVYDHYNLALASYDSLPGRLVGSDSTSLYFVVSETVTGILLVKYEPRQGATP